MATEVRAGGNVSLKDQGSKGLMDEVLNKWGKRTRKDCEFDEEIDEKPKKRKGQEGGAPIKKEKNPEAFPVIQPNFVNC